jgi:hypothetical protein
MRKQSTCLVAALAYLRRGWSVVAVCPFDHLGVGKAHGRRCTHPGKAPLVAWKSLQGSPPTESGIRAWWTAWPNANVGIVLGPVSGLVGIDLDGRAGEELLRELSRGDLPDTLSFRTGRGRRLLYALPRGVLVPNRALDGEGGELRVLGGGSISVVPPSIHHSGRKYRWLPRRGPIHRHPAPAPEWVCKCEVRRNGAAAPRAIEVGGPIPEGQRNRRLFTIACAMRRHGCTPGEILSTLWCVNGRCLPPLHDRELREIVASSSRYPPAW